MRAMNEVEPPALPGEQCTGYASDSCCAVLCCHVLSCAVEACCVVLGAVICALPSRWVSA
jgi:hypothetical protein